GALEVTGLDAAAIGEIALTTGVALHELTPVASTLEDAYLELTADAVEYRTDDLAGNLAAAGSTSPRDHS
ncbi:MAG TPA: ABC transporter ATP-binding protein, partial [Isoptericola sp.]|nr:ABC transporter ATP-binding protein [Isoptericola sp.]